MGCGDQILAILLGLAELSSHIIIGFLEVRDLFFTPLDDTSLLRELLLQSFQLIPKRPLLLLALLQIAIKDAAFLLLLQKGGLKITR